MKRRTTFLRRLLRDSSVCSALIASIAANATAATPAKPAAAPAVTPPAPATPGKPLTPPSSAKATGARVAPAALVAPAAPIAQAAQAAPPAPKPRPKPPAPVKVAPPPAPAEAAASKEEVAALRDDTKNLRQELKALREDLNRAVGAPDAGGNAERERLQTELDEARRKRAAIQAAVDGGLDRAAVADSIATLEARIAAIESELAQRSPSGRSLAQVSSDVERLDAAVARQTAAAPASPPAIATAAPATPAAAESPAELKVSKEGFFQPSANLQVWAGASHLTNPATPNESWTNMLRIRRAELKIKGEIIRKTFGYAVMFDPARLLDFANKTIPVTGEQPAPTNAGSVSVAQPPPGGSTSILQDAWLTYFNDYADISVGQFKVPVSLEGSGSATKLYLPERALVSRKYGDRRDLGIKAEKKFDSFGFTLGVFNGEGQNKLDSNDQKDVALRLEVYPVKDVTLAAVGYTSVTERDLVGTKDRVEGDLKLEKYHALLQAEYIRGWDTTGTAAKHQRVQGQGFYVLAGYTFFDKLQPVARIGSLDPDIDHDEHGATAPDPNDETTSYELGVNYYFKGHDAKLQMAGGFFDPEQRSQHTRFDFTLAAQLAF